MENNSSQTNQTNYSLNKSFMKHKSKQSVKMSKKIAKIYYEKGHIKENKTMEDILEQLGLGDLTVNSCQNSSMKPHLIKKNKRTGRNSRVKLSFTTNN